MNRIFQFICMLISVFMIASCSPGNEHEFNINTLPPINLSSGNYHVRNFPSRIRAINDSQLILIPVPAKELILFNLFSGDSLAGLSLSGEEIESLKRETVIPEMAGKLIISRDSFVSYTRYDPGSIEFSDISVSGRDVYVAFNLPVYYMDTIRKEYRYYPAVYVGKMEGREIRDIRYLPGYPMQKGEKNPANLLNRDWPFMPYGFKVLDSKIFAFNMTDTTRYGNEDVPVLMCYGNCTDKKCEPDPTCYPAIFLNNKKELAFKSNFESGSVLFNKSGNVGIAWWNDSFYKLPAGDPVFDWMGKQRGDILSFDFLPGSDNLLLSASLSGGIAKNSARNAYLKLWDVKAQKEILKQELMDSTRNINSMNLDILGKDIYYLNFENYELYHLRLE